ncbi:hypothetical protein [Muricoccus pecuniae]|uniref:Uncharacterized protein n=1 Tax=Muricoccus pecuniae TaxID=693023 RepID=A0A840YM01_9PROT|nr:hypothetical protein [Roseomonas pecuniae]MBB5695514.1 hypothetical protein [Roseomonas pecuniae]
MSQNAFEEIYSRVIDAELGLRAILEIVRNNSSGDDPRTIDMRNNAIEWCATRMAEQIESISTYAEDQARRAREGRRG